MLLQPSHDVTPDGSHVFVSLQVGKAAIKRVGKDVVLVGFGHSVNECLAAAETLAQVNRANFAILHASFATVQT